MEETTCEESIKAFHDRGLPGLCQKLIEIRNGSRLHVGVVGSSGSGKSSLVNTLINIDAEEEGAAKVDEIETTNISKRYTSRRYPGLYIWDVPGVGTQQHPRATYMGQQRILTFDLVIIVSSGKFTEDDAWLVDQLCQNQRRFFFVRTYIDNSIGTSCRRRQVQSDDEGLHQEEVMDKVRQDCLQRLCKVAGLREPPMLFLVCSFYFEQYDFPNLWENLIAQDTLASKLHAVEQTIRPEYRKTLKEKKVMLQERIKTGAIPSALMSVIPVRGPGFGVVCDLAYIKKVFNDYRSKLGIDEDSLTKYAEMVGISKAELERHLNLQVLDIDLTAEGIAKLVSYRGVAFASKFLPTVGSLVAAGITYTGTNYLLHDILDMAHDDALKVHDYMLKRLIQ